tara:strand:+ start:146 stop:493 length:348 start_codon:yes stop_codon:yes gene_type:complete
MSNINNTSFMNLEEYKKYIGDIIYRLISEKQVFILKENKHNKICFKIQLNQVEWYTELDDDIKYNVQINLQKYFMKKIEELVKNMNHNDILNNEESQKYNTSNDNNNLNKRQKLD